MAKDRAPQTISTPLSRSRGSSSSPLAEVEVYRPGPYLALGVLLLPVVAALGGAALYLNVDGTIPFWLPLIFLVWAPLLPPLWLTMQAVRTSAADIAAGRPWRRWVTIPWENIERAERLGLRLRLTGSRGERVTFLPLLLRDGKRLERQLFLRLPAHVLTGTLSQEAQKLHATGIRSTPRGGYSGTLVTRARARWRLLPAAFGLVALAAGMWCVLRLPSPLGMLLATGCGLLTAVSAVLLLWMSQTIRLHDKGMSIVSGLWRRERSILWDEVDLIEQSPRQRVLRLRGRRSLVCVGPGLLTPTQAVLVRGLLHEYCVKRDKPLMQRSSMFWRLGARRTCAS